MLQALLKFTNDHIFITLMIFFPFLLFHISLPDFFMIFYNARIKSFMHLYNQVWLFKTVTNRKTFNFIPVLTMFEGHHIPGLV